MELDDAVEDLDPLSFLLGRLLDQLCARLSTRSLAAASIRVRFELQPAFENALDSRKELGSSKTFACHLRNPDRASHSGARFENAFEAAAPALAIESACCSDTENWRS